MVSIIGIIILAAMAVSGFAVLSVPVTARAKSTDCGLPQCSSITPVFTSRGTAAPIAVSDGNNVYVSWWSNKTGNDEVMFKASTDGGKTFSNKMDLSNTPKSDSQDAQIAAAGSNVYVTWWERNQTSNEPVLRVSNDNGKSFGELIMLSAK
jgi:hypothetical protein